MPMRHSAPTLDYSGYPPCLLLLTSNHQSSILYTVIRFKQYRNETREIYTSWTRHDNNANDHYDELV